MLCHVLCSKCARTCPWVACCQACCRHRLRGAARHQLLCEVVRQWQAVQHAQLAPRLPMAGAAEPLRLAASFALIFIATVFAGGMLAWLVKKLVSAIGLQPADRTMGAAFGLLRGLVLLLAVVFVVNMTPLRADGWWQQSAGVPLLNAALRGLQPVLDSLGVSSRWPAGYSPGKSP